eukprot:gene29581-36656_t
MTEVASEVIQSDLEVFDDELDWNSQLPTENDGVSLALSSDANSINVPDNINRVREQKLKETVQNIAGKLKWHADEMDRKSDSDIYPSWTENAANGNTQITTELLLAQFSSKNFGDDDVDSDVEQIEKYAPLNESNMRSLSHTHNAKEFLKPAPHNNEDHIRLNDIAPIVYALSRGTDRVETLKTVD